MMPMHRRALLALAATLPAGAARAAWPERPVTLMVGYGAGGATDVIARALAERAGSLLGQPMVVLNVPGAGGTLASDRTAKAAPDGQTILLIANAHVVAPGLYASLPYDTVGDFAPVAFIGQSANVLVVPASAAENDLAGLAARAKASSQPLRTGSAALAGFQPAHELLREALGIELEAVPYRSGPQGQTDLIAGRLDLMVSNVLEVSEHVKAGRLKALAVTSAIRSPLLPEVPTFVELGIPALQADSWFGLLAPRATPPDILDRLHDALATAMAEPAMQARLTALGILPQPMSRQEWGAFLAAQTEKWSAIPRRASVQIQ
ncbi:tripartite tricarboxylate transporter substrate binding protein [Roseomonas aerophila]|uniref:Tripartite tricarboxylate transporter substrate binding protein n=1 Tax=Teichococcus aerophilus TaxID=1224513 RepID=A0ABR7RKW6_9PROT|nr:tripartite tricarboxylate transporter substrate-binding protein [Pseudoroseomonas aerophila]MBC9207225.1 tripartite tricarboxylate transporter substrate binding protein [Pseudoroseomonas aerophila]